MRPFCLGDRTFNDDVINLPVVITTLSLGIEVGFGTSSNCEDCAMGGVSISLLWMLLDLRWRWWVGFSFDLRASVV
jgi:hypothetical protein